jgi:anti-sigma regulatory factor (Ser/Thr protein kinase)
MCASQLRDRAAATLEEAREVPVELLRHPTPPPARGPAYGERRAGFALRLPRVGAAVAFARRDLDRWLRNRGFPESDAFEICLAASEVLANAVQHPLDPQRPEVQLGAVLDDDLLLVVVHDFGGWRPQPPAPDRGRGLTVARRLMDGLEIEHAADGTYVTMHRRTRPG